MFSISEKAKQPLKTLHFKTNQEFFDYQCQYGVTDIQPNRGIVAIVIDAVAEFGAQASVHYSEEGISRAILRVASTDGGFIAVAETAGPSDKPLKPGDLVVWVPIERQQFLENAVGDERTAWLGLILAEINPVIDPATGTLDVARRFVGN